MTIILYDLVSLAPGKTYSPNTRKARFCLNFKGIPYRTEWVEWPGIKGVYEKHNIEATSYFPNGSPRYTLPVIHDTSTGSTISDSFAIAEYLDKTFPNTPPVFPHNTKGLQASFDSGDFERICPMIMLIIPDICHNIMTPTSLPVYQPYVEIFCNMKMSEFDIKSPASVAKWTKYKASLDEVAKWYGKTNGPFLMGDTISWADFVVVSPMLMIKTVWGEDSEQWKEVNVCNGGIWGKLIKELDKYNTIV
ncbi:hypothetical protein BDN70DRAFT_868895 [Pholiota conissans]|uniref:GST N-terminal domain-containing protein n=1 Tax=Pholiota conissans TaxID=109636 RepID=A0A9P6CTR7_9AGAR|nr:hypothetical protein BDN70DRAFT_868895 [Pholiota conissans]